MPDVKEFFTIDDKWNLGSATVYAGPAPIGKISMFAPDRYQFHCSIPGAPSRSSLGQTWFEAVALYFMWAALAYGPFTRVEGI